MFLPICLIREILSYLDGLELRSSDPEVRLALFKKKLRLVDIVFCSTHSIVVEGENLFFVDTPKSAMVVGTNADALGLWCSPLRPTWYGEAATQLDAFYLIQMHHPDQTDFRIMELAVQTQGAFVKLPSIQLMLKDVYRNNGKSVEEAGWIAAEFLQNCHNKQKNIVNLKAIFLLALRNQIVAAEAFDLRTFTGRQLHLFNTLFNYYIVFCGWLFQQMVTVYDSIVRVWNWLGNENCLAIVELLCLILVLVVIVRVFKKIWPKLNLAKTRVTRSSRWISKVRCMDGYHHTVEVNGVICQVLEPDLKTQVVVEEMAMPGSELFVSSRREIGVIMGASSATELKVIGLFCRIDDQLVTALHVANCIINGVVDIYLVNLREKGKGFSINLASALNVKRELFAIESNEYKYDLDVFAATLPLKTWASLGIGKSSVKKNSIYGQVISAVGFCGGETLMTSTGKTLENSGPVVLHHTASTQGGFSGGPIYSGNNVVGIHVSGTSDYNIAVRIEAVLFGLRKEKPEISSDYEIEEFEGGYRYKGSLVEVHDFDQDHIIISRTGKVCYIDDEDWDVKQESKYQRFEREEDEPRRQEPVGPGVKIVPRKFTVQNPVKSNNSEPMRWGDYENNSVNSAVKHYHILEPQAPVHCNIAPKVQPEIKKVLDAQAEKLVTLGYKKGEYQYPDINPNSELKSIKKHLELYGRRNESIQTMPTEVEIQKVVAIVVQLLPNNKFECRSDYKSNDNLARIIESNLVNEKKSPGQPWQSEGYATNGQVIEKLGVGGLIECVRNFWNEKFQLKLFIKGEPHKKKKIDEEMLRPIAGFPLTKMIKHQAIFREMLDTAVQQWKHSPIKYGYSPHVPGDLEHLIKQFEGADSIYESDKTNWDFNMFDYLFVICKKIIVQLALRPTDMEDADWNEYIKDIEDSIDEVRDCEYRCTNGTMIKSGYKGIMKSGWLLTIFVNSLAQLVSDMLFKVRMGIDTKELLSASHVMVCGGDDIVQSFPVGFDVEKYVTVAKQFGFVIELKKHKTMKEVEFFGNVISHNQLFWTFVPVRFTKHIENLSTTKLDDLAMALSSHMTNYVWDTKRFRLFDELFCMLRKEYPDKFPVHLRKSQMALQYKNKGLEGCFI